MQSNMRLLTRTLLLLAALVALLLLLFGRCGLNLGGADITPSERVVYTEQQQKSPLRAVNERPTATAAAVAAPSTLCQTSGHYEQVLRDKEAAHQQELQKLVQEVSNLKLKLLEVTRAQSHSNIRLAQTIEETSNNAAVKQISKNATAANQNCQEHIRRQINSAEIGHGVALNNEHEIIAFSHFTFNRIYPAELRLGKRVVEKPIGFRRKDLVEVFVRTLDLLNRRRARGTRRYTADDIVEGIYRTEPTTGTHYELFVRDRNHSLVRVTMLRPFAALQTVAETAERTDQLINVIVPLSGRLEAFAAFLERFVRVGLKEDGRVCLTVVYFGVEGVDVVRDSLARLSKENNFHAVKLLALNESFSRGRGLQAGAGAWPPVGDVLLFLCDVDVAFTSRFLQRCRLNSSPSRRVYYPILFSLYNPAVVYSLHDRPVPSEKDQLLISRESGFWRDFGYGMTCQYLSDFRRVGGFDDGIVGWGGEDVLLYRKYVQSALTVVRATDPGIFHLWHEKRCDPRLTTTQYWACIHTRVINEASHEQLGLLAYKDDIEQHKMLRKSGAAVTTSGANG